MCSRFGPAFAVIVALAVPPATHASDERHSPEVGSVNSAGSGVRGFAGSEGAAPALCDPANPRAREPANKNSQPKADPLSNGIGIGAALGAGVGLGLVGWAYAQCDDTCDAPEPGGMYALGAGMGAAIGAAVGLVIDAARKKTNQRVLVAAAATPQRAAVQVRVRW